MIYILSIPATACAEPVTVCILLPKIDCRQNVANVRNVVNVMIINPKTIKNMANFQGNG